MIATQSLQSNRIYSIALMKQDSQCSVYHVKIKGDTLRNFFVETVASRISPGDAIKRIELL